MRFFVPATGDPPSHRTHGLGMALVHDVDGSFVLNDVPPGAYTLTIYAGKEAMERAITVTSPRTEVAVASSADVDAR